MWKGIKKKFGLFLLLVLLIVSGSLSALGLFANSNMTINQTTEKTIASKYSTNGSYFGPSYFFVSDDALSNRISTNKMYDLQVGDTYTVRGKATIYDILIIAGVVFILGSFLVWLIWILTIEVFGETRWINRVRNRIHNSIKTFEPLSKVVINSIVIIFICISIICLCLIGKNTLFKIIPVGKSITTATILDREEKVHISPYSISSTYTFTLQYNDNAGNMYQTLKDVSHFTFVQYKHDSQMPLAYRDKRPYDVFVVSQSFREYSSSLFRLETGIIAIVLYLTYFFIRKYLHSLRN